MAIATTAAILGAAAIGAAGSAISSSNSNKAVNKATDAQVDLANQNNALTREIYNTNRGILDPFVQRGNAAGVARNALLGLGPQMSGPGAAQMPANSLGQWGGPQQQGNALAQYGGPTPANDMGQSPYGVAQPMGGYQTVPGQTLGNDVGYQTTPTYQQQPAQQSGTSPYEDAFANYRNSTGYQFRVNEGNRALNSGYAAKGLLQSGAAQKAALQYGQNIASGEFGNYMGYLGQQQGVGLSAGSALAGVGTNYAGQVGNNNALAADAIANGALLKSQNNNALWNNLANVGGMALGYSSYGRR